MYTIVCIDMYTTVCINIEYVYYSMHKQNRYIIVWVRLIHFHTYGTYQDIYGTLGHIWDIRTYMGHIIVWVRLIHCHTDTKIQLFQSILQYKDLVVLEYIIVWVRLIHCHTYGTYQDIYGTLGHIWDILQYGYASFTVTLIQRLIHTTVFASIHISLLRFLSTRVCVSVSVSVCLCVSVPVCRTRERARAHTRTHAERERGREREREGERDREKETVTDATADVHTHIHTYRHRNTGTETQTQKTQTQAQTQTQTYTQTHRHTDAQTHRQTQTHRHTDTHTVETCVRRELISESAFSKSAYIERVLLLYRMCSLTIQNVFSYNIECFSFSMECVLSLN